jgi:hypothetical protein
LRSATRPVKTSVPVTTMPARALTATTLGVQEDGSMIELGVQQTDDKSPVAFRDRRAARKGDVPPIRFCWP